MNSLLVFLWLLLCVAIILTVPAPGEGASAVLLCATLAAVAGFILSRTGDDRRFLLQIFVGALLIRMFVGLLIFVFHLEVFFGGDAITYDFFGYGLLRLWEGDHAMEYALKTFIGSGGSGWGMVYMVAGIYKIVGQNMLAVQFVNAILGAMTAPIIFLSAHQIFGNKRVARIACLFVAFYPSLILWSSQGLKDGPIVFMLATSMLATLKLGEKFTLQYLLILICSLFGVLAMRFYVFYILVAAVAAAFVLGTRTITAQSFARQFIIIISVGLALTYLGISRYANQQVETYGDLQHLQASRLDASRSAKSGFGSDVDVSSTSGVLTTIPTGMLYLLFAPFPWQLTSLRSSITLPEMMVWWGCFPLLILGLWFAVKYYIRRIFPILIFTSMLTLAYSVFEGNLGTAYRQRSQLLIFYFIFVAVGLTLFKERRENAKALRS